MGLFDWLKKKSSPDSDSDKTKEIESVLVQAEEAARIVENGISNGDYSDMNEQLINLYSQQITKERFVFRQPSLVGLVIPVLICILLSIVFLVFLRTGMQLDSLTSKYSSIVKNQLITSISIIAVNIIICLICIKEIRYYLRYKIYLGLLERKNIEFIDVMADCLGKSTNTVIRDLKKAVRIGLVPQGHFTKDNIVFMVSDELYYEYKRNQEVHDQYYRQILNEKAKKDNQSPETKAFIQSGSYYLSVIRDSNAKIKNKAVSQKLTRLEKTVEMIIREVAINANQKDKLGTFIDYYLPTTEKLLKAYIDVDKTTGKSKNAIKAKNEIITAIDTINNAFENILDQLYKEIETEVFINTTTIEKMMQLEGITEYMPSGNK